MGDGHSISEWANGGGPAEQSQCLRGGGAGWSPRSQLPHPAGLGAQGAQELRSGPSLCKRQEAGEKGDPWLKVHVKDLDSQIPPDGQQPGCFPTHPGEAGNQLQVSWVPFTRESAGVWARGVPPENYQLKPKSAL